MAKRLATWVTSSPLRKVTGLEVGNHKLLKVARGRTSGGEVVRLQRLEVNGS